MIYRKKTLKNKNKNKILNSNKKLKKSKKYNFRFIIGSRKFIK